MEKTPDSAELTVEEYTATLGQTALREFVAATGQGELGTFDAEI